MSAEALRWRDQARVLRGAQRMVEADQAITRARTLAPADPLIAFLHAQSRYELGHPAAALFAEVCRLWPDNLDALRNRALAEASEGRPERARDLLAAALAEKPGWAAQRVAVAAADLDRFYADLSTNHSQTSVLLGSTRLRLASAL